jgi:hypothetical protein
MAYTGRSQTTNRFGQVPQTSLPGTGPHSLGRAPDRAARPVMVAGYIGLDKQQIPHSSVLTRTAQQIGGSFGTAVLAVILEGAIAAHPATLADAFHVAFCGECGEAACPPGQPVGRHLSHRVAWCGQAVDPPADAGALADGVDGWVGGPASLVGHHPAAGPHGQAGAAGQLVPRAHAGRDPG